MDKYSYRLEPREGGHFNLHVLELRTLEKALVYTGSLSNCDLFIKYHKEGIIQ